MTTYSMRTDGLAAPRRNELLETKRLLPSGNSHAAYSAHYIRIRVVFGENFIVSFICTKAFLQVLAGCQLCFIIRKIEKVFFSRELS